MTMFADVQELSSGAAKTAPESILLIASRQAVYQSLADAFRQHFRSHDVVLADGGGRLPGMSSALGLVLISVRVAEQAELEDLIDQVRQRAPGTPIGLLIEEGFGAIDHPLLNKVEGVLPLSLPLDVLMAVVSLLLAGGNYNPNGLAKRAAAGEAQREVAVTAPATGASAAAFAHGQVEIDVRTLTTREEQILQYVSEGFQNKLIADRMALSEHTVKAHVHKVIAKLGVSNRTQAAAAFLRRKNGGSRQVISEARQP